MLQKIIDFIKNNRALVLAFGLFLLFLVFYNIDRNQLTGDVQNPQVFERAPPEALSEVVRVSPPNGTSRETIDVYAVITIEFDREVDPEFVTVTTTPKIPLEVVQSFDEPRKITIFPRGNGWVPNIEYTVLVKADFLPSILEYKHTVLLKEESGYEDLDFPM